MPVAKRYLDRFDSAGRKKVPMFSGVMAYFPDAIAALAEHSFKGNEKHNPGEPLHHARGKSMDHTDCIMRHLANYNGLDGDALEAVALFWRAGALCQEVLERKYGLTLPEGVVDPRAFPETNSLVGPNGEQALTEAPKGVAAAKYVPDTLEEIVALNASRGFKAPRDNTERHDHVGPDDKCCGLCDGPLPCLTHSQG
jgi:hypothetical protein